MLSFDAHILRLRFAFWPQLFQLRGFSKISVLGNVAARGKVGVLASGSFISVASAAPFVASSCARSNKALKSDWPVSGAVHCLIYGRP